MADSRRCQHVEIAELAVAALEVLRLDPALGQQRLQHVVRLAEADPQLARELALRILRVLLEEAEQGDGGVLVGGGGGFRVHGPVCSTTERASVQAPSPAPAPANSGSCWRSRACSGRAARAPSGTASALCGPCRKGHKGCRAPASRSPATGRPS